MIALGYYGSVTRLNARFRDLLKAGFVRRLETPFFSQGLYSVTPTAASVVGPQIAALLTNRSPSPRFLQHALTTTNVRIAMLDKGATAWRFEQQLWTSFEWQGRSFEVRPDGLAVFPTKHVAVEVDMGNMSHSRLQSKFDAYQTFVASRSLEQKWAISDLRVLLVTTSQARAERIGQLLQSVSALDFRCVPLESLGVRQVGSWS
ncbi:MAG: replication-relaxation family protein [Methanoregulaceae archaeon]|nr:replication-relaxation family protein [Methanoregulaceae archaeon]